MRTYRKNSSIFKSLLCVILLIAILVGIAFLSNHGNSKRKDEVVTIHNTENNFDIPSSLNYEISIRFGEVQILTSDETPYIETKGSATVDVITLTNNDTIKIEISPKEFFGFQFDKGFEIPKVFVYLPKEFNSLKVNTSGGYSAVNGINANKLDVNVTGGDSQIKKSNFKDVISKVNAGNLDLYSSVNTSKIISTITAGNTNLYLPTEISGFRCDYNILAGNIDDNTNFNGKNKQFNLLLNKSGAFDYGDKSCKIDIDVSGGNFNLVDY